MLVKWAIVDESDRQRNVSSGKAAAELKAASRSLTLLIRWGLLGAIRSLCGSSLVSAGPFCKLPVDAGRDPVSSGHRQRAGSRLGVVSCCCCRFPDWPPRCLLSEVIYTTPH